MSLQPIWVPYCGAAPAPAEWLGRWNWDPVLLIVLGALALGYMLRFAAVEPRRRACFGAALLLLLLLFVSPFCALGSGCSAP